MKASKKNEDILIAEAFLNEFQKYAKEHSFKKNIEYIIYPEDKEYRVKIVHDDEGILQKYLDEME